MHISELHYHLPPELIAHQPADERDRSRLLVLDRVSGDRRHEQFRHLAELLPRGALLVLNDTRVLPARLVMRRATGGRVEGLFLSEPHPGTWEVMLTSSSRLKSGEALQFDRASQRLRLVRRSGDTWWAEPMPAGDAMAILTQCGRTPLPPYIRRESANRIDDSTSGQTVDQGGAEDATESLDRDRYQTVYAARPGAVAAPTAGLHFTPRVFEALRHAGIEAVRVTLHVGVGTFAPIRTEHLADHPMHEEWYACSDETASAINAAREAGRPIVAVGTTSARVLETVADDAGRVAPAGGRTRIFIYPPYRFRAVDALLTNFHLPSSTLLAMVFAFAGRDAVLAAYEDAIRLRYRFYSYGDAMLIL